MKKRVLALLLSLMMLVPNNSIALAGEVFTDSAETAAEGEKCLTEESQETAADIFEDGEQSIEPETEVTTEDEDVDVLEDEMIATSDEISEAETKAEEYSADFVSDSEDNFVITDAADAVSAASDATSWCGHSYKVYETAVSASEASSMCQQMGGYLATYTSIAERDFILSLLDNKDKSQEIYYYVSGASGVFDNGWKSITWDNGEVSYYTDEYDLREVKVLASKGYGRPAPGEALLTGHDDILLAYKSIYLVFNGYQLQPLGSKKSDFNANRGFICEWGDRINIEDVDVYLDGKPLGEKKYTFTGNEISPSLSLKYKGVTLENYYDYKYEYIKHVGIGSAQIKITGLGRFQGEMTKTFDIVPTKGSIKSVVADEKTAAHTLQVTVNENEQASGYQVEYSEYSDFSTLVQQYPTDADLDKEDYVDDRSTEITLENLDRDTAYYVRARVYTRVNGKAYKGEWSDTVYKSTNKKLDYDDMLGITNNSNIPPYEYYKKVLGTLKGRWYKSIADGGNGGVCYGLSLTSLTAIYKGIEGIDADNLISYREKLEFYPFLESIVYYAHVYQNVIGYENKNNYSGLYNAIVNYCKGSAAPPIITINSKIDGEIVRHALVPIDIEEETDSYIRIKVYDSNHPESFENYNGDSEKILTLKKSGTKITGWKYTLKYHWGSDQKDGWIAYSTGVENKFYNWLKNNKAVLNQKIVSVTFEREVSEENLQKFMSNSNQKLSLIDGTVSTTIEEMDAVKNTVSSAQYLFQVEGNDTLILYNVPKNTEVVMVLPYHSITSYADAESTMSFSLEDQIKNLASVLLKAAGTASVKFDDAVDQTDTISTQTVSLSIPAGQTAKVNQTETTVRVTGATQVTFQKETGTIDSNGDMITTSASNKDTIIKLDSSKTYEAAAETDGKVTFKTSSKNNQTFDTIVYSSTSCTHQYETVVVKAKTCTEDGLSQEVCKLCGNVKEGSDKTIAHGHNNQLTNTENATYSHGTINYYTCQDCGQVTKVEENDKLNGGIIKLNYTSIKLKVKQSTTKVKVSEMASGDAIASWKSMNTKIAAVTKTGKITGKKVGTTKIKITLKSGTSAYVKVKVQKAAVACSSIKLNVTGKTLKIGDEYPLTTTVSPVTCVQKVTYKSSNKKVATVNSSGRIFAKKKGTAVITVKAGKKTAKCKVTVLNSKYLVELAETSLIINKGESAGMHWTVTGPSGGKVTWKSSNSSVVSVKNGRLIAKKAGKATITAKIGSSSSKCVVTVKDSEHR